MVHTTTEIPFYNLEDIEADGQSGSPGDLHILQTRPQPLIQEKGFVARKNRVQNTGVEKSHDPPET